MLPDRLDKSPIIGLCLAAGDGKRDLFTKLFIPIEALPGHRFLQPPDLQIRQTRNEFHAGHEIIGLIGIHHHIDLIGYKFANPLHSLYIPVLAESDFHFQGAEFSALYLRYLFLQIGCCIGVILVKKEAGRVRCNHRGIPAAQQFIDRHIQRSGFEVPQCQVDAAHGPLRNPFVGLQLEPEILETERVLADQSRFEIGLDESADTQGGTIRLTPPGDPFIRGDFDQGGGSARMFLGAVCKGSVQRVTDRK
ncbi:MAG: hypothetical protein ACD_87C00309G0001 [uncultured bacterium]|nr:MAG: hypothetical protein ACD_87C00309G0001 [uncultured bacterium]